MNVSYIRRLLAFVVACCAVIGLTAAPAAAARPIVKPGVKVEGYSLSRAAKATVHYYINGDGCDASQLPELPFAALCAVRTVVPEGRGAAFTGHADVSVDDDTFLFSLVADVTDGEPVLGRFPRTHAQALRYWFDDDQLGAGPGRVTVDGATVTLTDAYVYGPNRVTLPDLGTHDVGLALYIKPLSVGTHQVTTSVTLDGWLVQDTYKVAFLRFVNDFTITVTSDDRD